MNKPIYILLSVVLLFLFFSITLSEFLFSDDIQNFQKFNSLVIAHPQSSVIKVALEENANWITQGRFTPLTFLWQEFVYMNVPSILAYRWFMLLMNFAGIAAFIVFVRSLNLQISFGVWIVCLCALMQFRIQYHDAYTSLHGMYQFLAVLIFLSLAFYVRYVRKSRWYFLFFSCIFYMCALLQGEVGLSVLFFMPASGLLLKVPIRKLTKHFLPFLVISVAYLGYVAWLKIGIIDKANVYTGLQSNFDLREMLSLLYRQMYACLPFTNLHRQIAIPQLVYHRFTTLPFITIAIIGISAFLVLVFYKRVKGLSFNFSWRLLFFILLLVLIPSLFILPSLKYQQTMPMGVGYLPVYLQNLGTATFLAYTLQFTFARNRLTGFLYSVVLITGVVVTFLFNSALINARSYELSVPINAQYKSIKEGVMNDVPQGSTVLIGYFWRTSRLHDEVFVNLLSKKFRVFNEDDYLPTTDDSAKQCYLLETLPGNEVYTKLYQVNCATGKRGKILAERLHQSNVYETEQEKTILYCPYK